MSCTALVRGNTVLFTASFYTPAGAVLSPASANVVIAYSHASAPATATVAMSDTLDVWTATWSSAVADAGNVDWHVQSSGPPSAAFDGSFTVTANAANAET